MNIAVLIIGILFFVIISGGTIVSIYKNHISSTKEVKATIIDKSIFEKLIMRKCQAPYTTEVYVVSFQAGEKILKFNVSKYSYENFAIDQRGVLRYKGNRLIDFHE